MKNLKRILVGSASVMFSIGVLMQCTSKESKNNNVTTQTQEVVQETTEENLNDKTSTTQEVIKESKTQEQNNDKQTIEKATYVNLYDGRAAFPDSVHESWEDGTLEDVRASVLGYIDGMISGIQNDIEKYKLEKDEEKLSVEEGKLERILNLKDKIKKTTDKEELNDLMHDEFKSGKYRDIYGSGN